MTTQPSLELADIFSDYGHLLSGLSTNQHKVIRAIKNCRTSALGGHKLKCNSCEYQKHAYNSCRNRHCPKCGFLARSRWIEKRREDLFDCQYFHVVFTLPSKLRALLLKNRELAYNLLFKASSETLKEIAADPKHLGAEVGFIGVLHTWSQNLLDHPHVHYLVPGGGLRDGKWISCKKDYFLPVKVLSKVFRGKVLNNLEESFNRDELVISGDIEHLSSYSNFKGLLLDCAEKDFVVYSKRPFAGPKQVINYLGQYTHRIAISNYRLVKVEDGRVFFKVRDKENKGQSKVTSLEVKEFMRRFLLHVLPKGYVRMRHYGLLGSRFKKEKIELIKKLLGLATKVKEIIEVTWKDIVMSEAGIDVDQCPKCPDGRLTKSAPILWEFNST